MSYEDQVGPSAREDPARDDSGNRLELALHAEGVVQVEAVHVRDDGAALACVLAYDQTRADSLDGVEDGLNPVSLDLDRNRRARS